MKILMLTNTFLPHVGGVARSVSSFTEALRERGHRVVVVAPTFRDMPDREEDVIRVPALQQFNGSDFSVRLPVPSLLWRSVEELEPDVVHSHHPFLLGDTALRLAAYWGLPMVFTHHTMYEQYTHYVPGDSPAMKQFVMRLATEYANLCDHVIAPSQSIEAVLRRRGVERPITSIPTGIDPARFREGDREAARRREGIPGDAFVVGHVGRLAPEKNLPFLARAVARFAEDRPDVHFLVVGSGPSEEAIRHIFERSGLSGRLHLTGRLTGQSLADSYHAMDTFAFASQSETQGMVLAEAMTAGVPMVAVDAPGAREVLEDGRNGRLIGRESERELGRALEWVYELEPERRRAMSQACLETAEALSLKRCTDRLEELYEALIELEPPVREAEENAWTRTMRLIEAEWQIWNGRTEAAFDSLRDDEEGQTAAGRAHG